MIRKIFSYFIAITLTITLTQNNLYSNKLNDDNINSSQHELNDVGVNNNYYPKKNKMSGKKIALWTLIAILHEGIAVGFSAIAYYKNFGYHYYGLAGVYLVLATPLTGEWKYTIPITLLYTGQGLYNDLYLLKAKTKASMARIFIENILYYHVSLIPALVYLIINKKNNNFSSNRFIFDIKFSYRRFGVNFIYRL